MLKQKFLNSQQISAILIFLGLSFVSVQSVFAKTFPCSFIFEAKETICMHVDVNWAQFERVSVDSSRPGGQIDYYFWIKNTSDHLDEAGLNSLGLSVFIRMDMSYMLGRESQTTAPVCNLAKETKGQWLSAENRSFYQTRSSVQAGIYYIQVSLKKQNSKEYYSMERVDPEDASFTRLKSFLETFDQNQEFDLRFVPWSNTYYFAVTPADNESPTSVKLILKQ